MKCVESTTMHLIARALFLVAASFALWTVMAVFMETAYAYQATTMTLPPAKADAGSASATPTSTPTCVRTWDVIPSPNDTTYDNILRAVAVGTSNDIWAVGYRRTNRLNEDRTLTMHWNGQQWSVVPSPNPNIHNSLSDVAIVSANDVWAVGYYTSGGQYAYSLALHWNGVEWTQIPSINPGPLSVFSSVVALSTDDVWAVGSYGFYSSNTRVLALHWDGIQWTQVPVSSPVGSSLRDISALAANDIWAVGGNASTGSLAYHWNGTQWSQVPTPQGIYPEAVKAISTNDVWAVGSYYEANSYRTRTMHWDGTQWTLISSPNVTSTHNGLLGVSAASTNDVWAIGYFTDRGLDRTLTMRWEGSEWSMVPSPNPASGHNDLYDVAVDPSGRVWAVGEYAPFTVRTLVLRYPGGCVTPTPTSATPMPTLTATPTLATPMPTIMSTFTPNPPSATPVPPTTTSTRTATATITAIPTATQCSLSFSDVPTTSTFYVNIRCLACRGILSGYADGTFRPNNDITRGQIAKVVSNAAGFSDDPGPQIYEDVPPSNTFYEWINRLSMRGHMGGYPCGGAVEPCGSGNSPYFRPNASATRGQLAKIVASAAALTGTPTGQRYADVDEDSTFYVWIEQLSSLGVMGGYTCGSVPTEPCDEEGRAYFRPSNNVTRGQASKIVANTFLPNCQTP